MMKVSEVQIQPQNVINYSPNNKLETTEKTDSIETASVKKNNNPVAWQKDILMQALDKLENNIQLDNSHPLDKVQSAPIESFEEALIELSFIKSPFFLENASQAQANLKPESVVNLFTSE